VTPCGDDTSDLLQVHPLTLESWPDFEDLFGARGAYGGCWCMWWRTTRAQFEKQQGEGNRLAMKAIVESGEVPGIVAYQAGKAVGWCSVAPRESYASLNRSHVLRRLDDTPVWSIVCLFVAREHRGKGVAQKLIEAAVTYVREEGGKVIEAYPTVSRSGNLPPVSSFMGIPSMFAWAGFVECARPSDSRMIMRRVLE